MKCNVRYFRVSMSVNLKQQNRRNGAVRPGDRKIFRCAIAKKMVISQLF